MCDITPVFERNGCASSGCHAAPIQGNLDLSGDQVARQLMDAPSHTIGCENRLIIDSRTPSRSLILQAIGAVTPPLGDEDTCQVIMPPSGSVSEEDQACLTEWVDYQVSLVTPSQPDPRNGLSTLESALRKVKTLIHGGAVTDTELMLARSEGLAVVIEQWIETTPFQTKMIEFFELALQQKFESNSQNQFGRLRGHRLIRGKLEKAMQEVIPRTALHFIMNDQDFTQVATTRSWLMNTASLITLMFPDQSREEGQERHIITGDENDVPQTLRGKINQKHWYAPGLEGTCDVPQSQILEFFNGFINNNRCESLSRSFRFSEPPLTDQYFDDWRLVQINTMTGASPDELIPFYDIVSLSEATAITTRLPRVGFFTSSAFLNQWPTNVDNQFRVTVNQAIITALHIGFVSSENTEPTEISALDEDHAEPGTECYGCHRQLDPMRVYFAHAYNANYRYPTEGQGQEVLFDPIPRAGFAFRGEVDEGGRVGRFANNLANHPRWSSAWIQKVCLYANSSRCDESDPIFIDIKTRFESSNRFLPMLVEFLSSPLVTGIEEVVSRVGSPIVSITRRDQICGLLSERLSETNICERNLIRRSIGLIPNDSYARGAVDFTQPTLASPFFFAAAEAVCESASTIVVTGSNALFSSTTPDVTLQNLITHLMSVPSSNERYAGILEQLTAHYQSLVDEGLPARQALRSAFTVACLSPDVMGVGL